MFGGFLDAVSDLDDMSAALGNFVFRVTVAGQVAPGAGGAGHRVTLSDVGVYVRDSYDFNGDQPLGFWNERTNQVSTLNPLVGDFVVYSDVKRVAPGSPNSFVL